ncbi:MAG TPA: transcriptional coactivator p15/PC4 family protein [Turneriella sp.]|nr:transcriptional coactivator p15/PC4 family protein [Turneriella sp.]HNA78019.1 transcriptional coactivator p15/PC4 family protein [Turneriella sp.]HNE19810.1 transcriptional coactivator p15/PC4 family protein [Turneriella sp.]HNL09654.1 transcriptional coactivator p15/PC4 family protein [Turneriella sp.]HNL53124.1 transcriptional coactivator p15/PC4 family protein [Turneriella sp.]
MENKILIDIEKGRGEVIRVEVGEFKGKKLLHLRTWYTNDAGELAPTKKGVALSYEQFQKLKSILPQVDDIMVGQ